MRLSPSRFVGWRWSGSRRGSQRVRRGWKLTQRTGAGDGSARRESHAGPPATPCSPRAAPSCLRAPSRLRARSAPDFQATWTRRSARIRGSSRSCSWVTRFSASARLYVGLIKILDRKGLCAATEGEELAVAKSSSFNEQYDDFSRRRAGRASGR